MSYEFASMSYPNEREMLDALVKMWITADGDIDGGDVQCILGEQDDSGLARDCIKDWGLDQPPIGWPEDAEVKSHMEQHNYSILDLANAFTRLRKRLTINA